MARIQSNVGLITGIPITDTVNQLIALQAQPRTSLIQRNDKLVQQSTAIAELVALALSVQLSAKKLTSADLFSQRTVTSSDPNKLTAAVTGSVPEGIYHFTPVRQAQTHHLQSSGFAALDQTLGSGTLSFGFGGFVDQPASLDELNGGLGVARGKIRITDRRGDSAVVDLRFARTVDDVLEAVNAADGIDVTAVASGDSFRLIDNTGQTLSNLIVKEVSGGTTAADLGLAGINVAASQATGTDVLSLFSGVSLNRLNDGNGINFSSSLSDLQVTFRDGSPNLLVDFNTLGQADANASATTNAAGGVNARITFTAVNAGGEYDDVRIVFIDDGGATKGSETVIYDDTDPNDKTLTFNIESGQTNADDVIAALAGEPVASLIFTAARATGGDGQGLIDLSDTATTYGGAAVAARTERTLGDVLNVLNSADPNRLKAALSAGGDRIVLTDLTVDGGGTFSTSSLNGGTAAEDLGLTGTATGSTIASRRLQAGLKTTLLTSLSGGQGLGTLGLLDITDRTGASNSVDLSSAETLDDVFAAINSAGLGITASVNTARNGIVLTDTTGSTASPLIVANGDGTNTADKLQIAVNAAQTSVNSGSLDRQSINRSTLLSSLNGGKGVAKGSFLVYDSTGTAKSVNLSTTPITTVGGIIDAINGLNLQVTARINDTGDGIALVDTSGGAGRAEIRDVGTGHAAADLRIAGFAVDTVIDSVPAQLIDGAFTNHITIDADDTLEDLVEKINDQGANVTASIFSSGSGALPFRLTIRSDVSGKAGELLIDASQAGFTLQQIAAARDALLLFGGSEGTGEGLLAASSNNKFDDLVSGLSITVNGASSDPVTVSVSTTDSKLVSTLQTFVDQYNKLKTKLDDLTFFNDVDNTTGVLFGSLEALRVENDLATLLSGRFFGVGSIQSLGELGLSLGDDGKLSLDTAKLQAKFAADPDAVEEFFTSETLGFAAKLDARIESIAGEENSLLISRSASLSQRIDDNRARIDFMTERLERQREFLLKQFNDLELAISKIQSNLDAISQIQYIPPVFSSSQ